MKVATHESSGSGFTLDIGDRQYLVTAAHVVPKDDPVRLRLELRGGVREAEAARLPG
jgi:S1-C subfamily serine protease